MLDNQIQLEIRLWFTLNFDVRASSIFKPSMKLNDLLYQDQLDPDNFANLLRFVSQCVKMESTTILTTLSEINIFPWPYVFQVVVDDIKDL